MNKFRVIINIKNPNYISTKKESEDMMNKEYYISFKCVKDSIEECMNIFYEKYERILKAYEISKFDIMEKAYIHKINTEICLNWEKMFPEKI